MDRLVEAGTFSQEKRTAEPILINGRLPGEPPRPDWMKVTARLDGDYLELKKMMRGLQLNTVCEEANCPNIYECWGMGTATLMILGDKYPGLLVLQCDDWQADRVRSSSRSVPQRRSIR